MTILFVLLTALPALSSDLGTKHVNNGFAKASEQAQVVEISVIDDATAARLFNKFRQDEEIPFNYPSDGCFAAATKMTRVAEQNSVKMGKVFITGVLQAKTDIPLYPAVKWIDHVAPVSYVKHADGKVELMVFDPLIAKGPLPLDVWKGKFYDTSYGVKPRVDEIYFGARFQYHPKHSEKTKTSWQQGDLDLMQRTFTRLREFEARKPQSTETRQESEAAF